MTIKQAKQALKCRKNCEILRDDYYHSYKFGKIKLCLTCKKAIDEKAKKPVYKNQCHFSYANVLPCSVV